jgi:hypothetical protein
MSVVTRNLLIPIHTTDPKKDILKRIGSVSDFDLFHNNVLVAIYEPPKTHKLGNTNFEFHKPDKSHDEYKYQTTVGLVIKKGPAAFVEDANQRFYGCDVEPGDWVVFRNSDGVSMLVKNVLCRRLLDVLIEGRIPHPDYVY